MWTEIAQQISQASGQAFEILDRQSIGGGCINQAYRISDGQGQSYFLKVNGAGAEEMFAAEALGLKQMAAAQAIRVPRPLCHGSTSSNSFIVMEDLDLSGRGGPESWAEMGRQLARLHRLALSSKGFGWERNNTIGNTPQINGWTQSWAAFWAEHRIGYQLKLANRRGGRFEHGERLLAAIPALLDGHGPEPSLVHGDLWSGNAAVTAVGEPVIFDPAVYYGDREVDLAMTELFGAFPIAFYQAYQETWPLPPGHERRKTLYNLYHILNHFNLFGGGYGSQAQQMIHQLLQ
jgi:fructosamine-3-kinase